MSGDWSVVELSDVAVFENRVRVPLSAAERAARPGPFPYWGANGPFDTVDGYLFEGPRVLVAEDGNTVVRADGRGTVHWATGRYWVNNHAHVLSAAERTDLRWLYYILLGARVRELVTGSAQPKLSMGSLKRLRVVRPPLAEQRAIASVLGALDDKIDSNRRTARAMREVVLTDYARRRKHAAERVPLGHLTEVITRGRAPKYVDDGVMVLNQKCIRSGELGLLPARRTDPTRVPQDERRVTLGDVLINSTGVGTLGRVALVEGIPAEPVVTDSHVTLVRANADAVEPSWLASELLARERDLVELAEGSTGQTELSKRKLVELAVTCPSPEEQRAHAEVAESLASARAGLGDESRTLTTLRDTLLPKLVSGKIRVPRSNDPDESLGTALEQHEADLEASPDPETEAA